MEIWDGQAIWEVMKWTSNERGGEQACRHATPPKWTRRPNRSNIWRFGCVKGLDRDGVLQSRAGQGGSGRGVGEKMKSGNRFEQQGGATVLLAVRQDMGRIWDCGKTVRKSQVSGSGGGPATRPRTSKVDRQSAYCNLAKRKDLADDDSSKPPWWVWR